MKDLFRKGIKVFAAMSLLFVAGCSSKSNDEVVEEKDSITVIVKDIEENEIANKAIAFEEGDTLVSLVEENFDNVKIEEGMIYNIESLETPEDWSEYICIYTNGEMSQVGIEEIELEDGLEVSFVMTELQW